MNRFTYQVFYEYSGPTITSPFRMEMSPEELVGALTAFPSDLRHFLDDPEVCIDQDLTRQTPTSIVVTVITSLPEQQADNGIKRCLNSFDLFGKKSS